VTSEARRGSDATTPATLLFVSHDRSLATHFDQTLSLADINTQAQSAQAMEG